MVSAVGRRVYEGTFDLVRDHEIIGEDMSDRDAAYRKRLVRHSLLIGNRILGRFLWRMLAAWLGAEGSRASRGGKCMLPEVSAGALAFTSCRGSVTTIHTFDDMPSSFRIRRAPCRSKARIFEFRVEKITPAALKLQTYSEHLSPADH